MKKSVICGLLWLAFSAVGFSTSLTIQSNDLWVDDGGGGFLAYLNGNTSNPLEVYCADYRNYVDPPQTYDVNIDTPNLLAPDDGLGDTRYGTTTTFTWNSLVGTTISMSGSEFGNAYDRYVMAGWLTTNYDPLNPGGGQDEGIQSAIWTLLDVDGTSHTEGDVATWLQNAVNFMSNTAQFNSFAADVRVYSQTDISGDNNLNLSSSGNRYATGAQEMIGVAPEPADLALVGCGLLWIGLLRKRIRA